VRKCGGALQVPALDLAAGVVSAREWLRKRIFQSFQESPAGAIAGLVKMFDPTTPDLEPGMKSVINSPFQPRPAAWSRFESACARQLSLYTKSA
jgi:hypothetical protein